MQKKTPTISVIIPAFNVENYIEETLSSLRNQTVYPDEVIIIDDGSTDSTLQIAKSFQFPFDSKIISTQNNGQGIARNLGAEKAKSDYIYFFDSDDMLDTRFIEFVKNKISESPTLDLVLFSGKPFHSQDYLTEKKFPNYRRGFSGDDLSTEKTLSAFLEVGRWDVGPSLYVVRKKLLNENGLLFHSWHHEDTKMFYQVILSSKKITVSNKVFFHRRIREHSIMTMSHNDKHVTGSKLLIEFLAETQKKYKNPTYRKFFARASEFAIEPYIKSCRNTETGIDIKAIARMLFWAKSPKLYLLSILLLANQSSLDRIREAKKSSS